MVDLFQLFGTSELSKEGGNPHENETRVVANTPKTDRLQSFDPFGGAKNQQNVSGFRCISCGQDLSDLEHPFLLVSWVAPCLVELVGNASCSKPGSKLHLSFPHAS